MMSEEQEEGEKNIEKDSEQKSLQFILGESVYNKIENISKKYLTSDNEKDYFHKKMLSLEKVALEKIFKRFTEAEEQKKINAFFSYLYYNSTSINPFDGYDEVALKCFNEVKNYIKSPSSRDNVGLEQAQKMIAKYYLLLIGTCFPAHDMLNNVIETMKQHKEKKEKLRIVINVGICESPVIEKRDLPTAVYTFSEEEAVKILSGNYNWYGKCIYIYHYARRNDNENVLLVQLNYSSLCQSIISSNKKKGCVKPPFWIIIIIIIIFIIIFIGNQWILIGGGSVTVAVIAFGHHYAFLNEY